LPPINQNQKPIANLSQ
ncbi:hypothetical protein AVEN_85448-1, partial [Araneus ventricosus]